MNQNFVDLDALRMQIREPKSRAYFDDALRSYRSGALRSAIASAWVATAYDLIAKYRELDSQGDAEARSYIRAWDAAVTNKNTVRLLELERDLLKHAHEKLAILDQYGLRAIERLVEDRHICAHPAFVGREELFEPSKELARLHLVSAVELVLSQPPVQGRSLFEAYGRDLVSPGFPADQSTAIDFVDQKYLQRLRDGAKSQFGSVLAKSAIKGVPKEWNTVRMKVIWSLKSVKNRSPVSWVHTCSTLVRLINGDDPECRQRVIFTLSYFPEIGADINGTAMLPLRELAANAAQYENWEAFRLAVIPEFADPLVAAFANLNDDNAAKVLMIAPLSQYAANAIQRFANARSFRGAEAKADQFLLPCASVLTTELWNDVFNAICTNNQIYNASGVPERIVAALQASHHRPSDAEANKLYLALQTPIREYFDGVWQTLQVRGWTRPNDLEPAQAD